ncbi:MAG: hypothetical protein AB1921_02150 [Thermodesulfobacteriota bacterium]
MPHHINAGELASDLMDWAPLFPLLSALGYSRAPGEAAGKIRELCDEGLSRLSFALVTAQVPVLSLTDDAIHARGLTIASPNWTEAARRMEGHRELHCFLATLGSGLDQLIEERSETSLFDGYVLDCLGSLLAEKAADLLEARLRSRLAGEGRMLSRRFSPGYCDWELGLGQQALLLVLGPKKIGVAPLPSGAMQPAKTVSGVIISAEKIPLASPCRLCKNASCRHRRA